MAKDMALSSSFPSWRDYYYLSKIKVANGFP